MAYIPIPTEEAPLFPLQIEAGTISHNLSVYPDGITPLLPQDAKEALIYTFVSVRNSDISELVHRGVYEFITNEGPSTYTKYLNVVFTKEDYVMNSQNFWIPVGGNSKTLSVNLTTYDWPNPAEPKALEKKLAKKRGTMMQGGPGLKTLKDHIGHFAKKNTTNDIYAEFFVIGYRR